MSPDIKLLLISDSTRFETNQKMLDVIEHALVGGVDGLLLREKHLDSAKLLALASQARELTTKYNAKLIIHTQADIAQAVDADGVHLDSKSINEVPKIRSWLNQPMLISASCHSSDELNIAQEMGADFALLSPVFPTQSHPSAPSLGAEQFLKLARQSDIPVVALGGIDTANRHQLNDTAIAVISTILDSKKPKEMALTLAQQ